MYFVVADRSHPETEKIYAKLESLAHQMKVEGYMPNTNLFCMGRMKRRNVYFMSMVPYDVQVEK